MMKNLILIGLLFMVIQASAQVAKPLQILCSFPKHLKAGQHIDLKVKVTNHLHLEKTGTLTLELTDPSGPKNVDGWFINVFPFQYFTSFEKEAFATSFPLTVPANYKGRLSMKLMAVCGDARDSISITIPIQSTVIHE